MISGRARSFLGIALIVVMFALMGLQSLSSADWTASTAVHVARAESIPSFKERLETSGSLEALMAQSPDGWVPVGPGVDYQRFQLPDPNNVHVARMDRTMSGLFLESSIAQGRLSGGLERTSGMFARYEGALNFWGQSWGKTNDVLVAINGSFYDFTTGIPDRGVIHSGWYAKRFSDNQNGSGFAWKLDGTTFIGECVAHDSAKQLVVFADMQTTEKYFGINTARGANDLILFTPQYDASTGTDASGVEVLVEMVRPTLVLPPPSMALGTVRAIRDLQGDTSIPFDHIVLSATGTKRTKILNNMQVGDVIGISSSISHFSDADCVTPVAGKDWTKTYASVGGSYFFLENGVINTFQDPGANVRNPRTAIAYNNNYIYFIVVDGRDPGTSIGMNMAQLGAFAKNSLGATFGINQDGGGSSAMVIDGVVVNTPSDRTPVSCPYQTFLPLIARPSSTDAAVAEPLEMEVEWDYCYLPTERAVANGMMMVWAQPLNLSGTFSTGQGVVTTGQTSLRLGPGSNYATLMTLVSGSSGTVQAHAGGLNGVQAKGQHWWRVNFGGVVGWVRESALAPSP